MTTAIVALLALLLGVEVARVVQVQIVARRARRELADQPGPPTAADVVAAARALPAPTAEDLLTRLTKQRYVVTLRGGEGDFAGILVEQQLVATHNGSIELMLVFEHCATMPTRDGDTTADIAGRVILGMSGIAYLQQIG